MSSERAEAPASYSRKIRANQEQSSGESLDLSLQEIIVVVDLDDEKFFSSPQFDLGGNLSDLVSRDGRGSSREVEGERKFLANALETLSFGPTLRCRQLGEMEDEVWCDVESKGTIIRDVNGTPSKIMAVIRDVSRSA